LQWSLRHKASTSRPAIEQLQVLVATWRGEKKLVGEAMLRPGFTVRNVPGDSKSSAARVRQVVLREFKSFISRTYKIVGTNGSDEPYNKCRVVSTSTLNLFLSRRTVYPRICALFFGLDKDEENYFTVPH